MRISDVASTFYIDVFVFLYARDICSVLYAKQHLLLLRELRQNA